jgi:hypothetical protein
LRARTTEHVCGYSGPEPGAFGNEQPVHPVANDDGAAAEIGRRRVSRFAHLFVSLLGQTNPDDLKRSVHLSSWLMSG